MPATFRLAAGANNERILRHGIWTSAWAIWKTLVTARIF